VAETLPERLRRTARLEAAVFEEVARDEAVTGTALALALGAILLDALGGGGSAARVLLDVAFGAARFGLWVGAIHLGARALGLGDALGPLFRALGFAALPFALGLLSGLPLVGGLVEVAKWVLVLAAFTIATRAALRAELPTAAGLVAVGLGLASLLARILP
jgi:hypothetical protein